MLNRRLTLEKISGSTNVEGVWEENWTKVDDVWAKIEPASAREEFQAGQQLERITHGVTIRWRSDVSTKQRFLYTSTAGATPRIFLIHSMLDQNEAHRELLCGCEEFVSQQVGAT